MKITFRGNVFVREDFRSTVKKMSYKVLGGTARKVITPSNFRYRKYEYIIAFSKYISIRTYRFVQL